MGDGVPAGLTGITTLSQSALMGVTKDTPLTGRNDWGAKVWDRLTV